jgi:hypothetical protein
MYFVQIAVLIAGSKSNWLDWLHVFNFNTASAFGGVCVAPLSPYGVMGFALLTPFVFFAELLISMMVHLAVSKAFGSRLPRILFDLRRYRRALAALFLFSYTQLATLCFQYLVRRALLLFTGLLYLLTMPFASL